MRIKTVDARHNYITSPFSFEVRFVLLVAKFVFCVAFSPKAKTCDP